MLVPWRVTSQTPTSNHSQHSFPVGEKTTPTPRNHVPIGSNQPRAIFAANALPRCFGKFGTAPLRWSKKKSRERRHRFWTANVKKQYTSIYMYVYVYIIIPRTVSWRVYLWVGIHKTATQTAHPKRPKRHSAVGATTSIENHPVVEWWIALPTVETKGWQNDNKKSMETTKYIEKGFPIFVVFFDLFFLNGRLYTFFLLYIFFCAVGIASELEAVQIPCIYVDERLSGRLQQWILGGWNQGRPLLIQHRNIDVGSAGFHW